MATLNVGMKVNRAITGATTVTANAYAMVTYQAAGTPSIPGVSGNISANFPPITRYFGPGQSIPASFTQTFTVYILGTGAPANTTVSYSLQSGVELINTI